MALKDRLRIAREAKGLTPQQAAARLGRTVGSVHQHENGSREPPGDVLIRYSQLYGASLDWLMRGVGAGPGGATDSIQLSPPPPATPSRGQSAIDLLREQRKKN